MVSFSYTAKAWSIANSQHSQSKFTIIKDCAKIADNTVLMPNSVVPALAYFEGAPGQFVSDLPESTQEVMEAETKAYYKRFQPIES